MRWIVRVDDVGQQEDQRLKDEGLEQFLQWWRAGDWSGLPVHLGVVPACVSLEEHAVLHDLEQEGAVICLHGWDHAERTLHPDDVRKGLEVFPDAKVHIPPYNRYDYTTLAAIPSGSVLLGGFGGEHHRHGLEPKMIGNICHVSGTRMLCVKAWELVNVIPHVKEEPWPVQIILHHRWDRNCNFQGLRQLRDLLAGNAAGVDEAIEWAEDRK
jgi:hypothetical protein